ncbi:MAG: hypothetical protein MZV63_65910 [Marinilabiliales bacterium]|nr:hypothetical protein [Marinilabiliales bacterium]
MREYDEPFVGTEVIGLSRVVAAAAAAGLNVVSGGRFHHLVGGSDKGRAVRAALRPLSSEPRTGADGRPRRQSQRRAHAPRGRHPRPRPQAGRRPRRRRPPVRARRRSLRGARGWREAVLDILRGAA